MRTRAGYTGGTKKNPTYYDLGDHTETIQLDFDPAKTTYEKLLDVFWSTHNHCSQPGSRQYMSAVFYHDEAQKKLALETRDRLAAKRKAEITTPVLPAGEFYLAEDYHQKYQLRQYGDLLKEFTAVYPDPKAFVASTAVTRVNAYLAGSGSKAMLDKEIDSFGLSPKGKETLLKLCKRLR